MYIVYVHTYAYGFRAVWSQIEWKKNTQRYQMYILSNERMNECHFICKVDDQVSSDYGKHAHLIFIPIIFSNLSYNSSTGSIYI